MCTGLSLQSNGLAVWSTIGAQLQLAHPMSHWCLSVCKYGMFPSPCNDTTFIQLLGTAQQPVYRTEIQHFGSCASKHGVQHREQWLRNSQVGLHACVQTEESAAAMARAWLKVPADVREQAWPAFNAPAARPEERVAFFSTPF